MAEYDVVRELHDSGMSKEELENEWRKRTGKAMDSYYRRKREMGLR